MQELHTSKYDDGEYEFDLHNANHYLYPSLQESHTGKNDDGEYEYDLMSKKALY